MFPSLYTWSSLERDMASDLYDYHESPDLNIVYEPGKPSLKNVSLPANSPASGSRMISTGLLTHHGEPSTSSSPHSKRYSSSASADAQKIRSSVPLKGILKKSQQGVSLRPSTPAPSAKDHVNTKSGATQSTPEEHRSNHRRSECKSSEGSSSKPQHQHMHEPQLIKGASSVAKLNEKILKSGDNHRKHYPMHIKVPMKPEAIALTWPLMEPNTTSPRKQRRAKICFDVAFDPRKDNNVVVLEGTYRMDSIPYQTIRLPASTHCTLTEMCIFLDMEEFNHWPINVMRKDGIRCLDVLEAIHKMLQRPLTDGDVRTFGLAAAQRGMRRVDLLGGRRFFRGLSQSGENWTLHMGSSWY